MSVQIPPSATRLEVLTAQYDASYEYFWDRVQGLEDAEYFWEPVKQCWNVRRRAAARTSRVFGKGQWVQEIEKPDPDPAPFTTIAWRLCHLVMGQMIRYDYTFGTKSLHWDDIELPGTAKAALSFLRQSHERWRVGLGGLSDADMDQIGLSSNPWGLDPQLPFGAIVWWTNRELIHHSAEIALVRDLWRAQHS